MSDQATVEATVETTQAYTINSTKTGSTELQIYQPDKKNKLAGLVDVALVALKNNPRFIKSILGPVSSWVPPYRALSEFTITDPWQPVRAINYLADITIPAFPREPNKWVRTFLPPVVSQLFWRPSTYFQQVDPFGSVTSFPKEQWFYINGIATNEDVARLNSQLLTEMFYRPVTVIQNMTDSTIIDLWECVIGKALKVTPDLFDPKTMTEPAFKAAIALLNAVNNPNLKRVVLVCHSQGTIITANVLRALCNVLECFSDHNQDSLDHLELLDKFVLACLAPEGMHTIDPDAFIDDVVKKLSKLEIYTFANCADNMNYVDIDEDNKPVPYIENFTNQHDLVAWLGVLSPLSEIIDIDGPVFEKKGEHSWGHLLNQHYLFDIQDYLNNTDSDPYPLRHKQNMGRKLSADRREKPRLYSYFEGGERIEPEKR